jgi:preprotein translocase subunit SecF
MNIIKNRYIYFLISLLVIIPGIVFMGLNWAKTKEGPLMLGVDFRGGSLLEVTLRRSSHYCRNHKPV